MSDYLKVLNLEWQGFKHGSKRERTRNRIWIILFLSFIFNLLQYL